MFHLTIRLTKPKQEDVKYLVRRLSSTFGATQILPTAFIINKEFDNTNNFIGVDRINDVLNEIDEKFNYTMQWIVTQVEYDGSDPLIEWGLNEDEEINKVFNYE